MPISNSPNMAALQASILAAITASKNEVKTDVTAVIAAKSAIKSIQRGTVAMSGAANSQLTQIVTIASVNLSKSCISISSALLGSSTGSQAAKGVLISATELELKAQSGTSGAAAQVSWEVIEYV